MASRRDEECVAVMRVELDALAQGLACGDGRVARSALATIVQQIHVLQLAHDPDQQTCARLTHRNNELVPRYTTGMADHG